MTGTREYQPETGLLKKVTATGPGTAGKLSELSYGHDRNRNVTTRQDAVNNRQESYRYDTLNRLTAWALGATTTSYIYDKVGNLKTETAPGTSTTYHYGENGAPRHALTGLNNDRNRFSYDGAGQQVTAVRRTVEYTTKGLPKAIRETATTPSSWPTLPRYSTTSMTAQLPSTSLHGWRSATMPSAR